LRNCLIPTARLVNVTLCWVTETIDSSFMPYADFVNAGALTWAVEAFRQ